MLHAKSSDLPHNKHYPDAEPDFNAARTTASSREFAQIVRVLSNSPNSEPPKLDVLPVRQTYLHH